jgi:hypothetical protein
VNATVPVCALASCLSGQTTQGSISATTGQSPGPATGSPQGGTAIHSGSPATTTTTSGQTGGSTSGGGQTTTPTGKGPGTPVSTGGTPTVGGSQLPSAGDVTSGQTITVASSRIPAAKRLPKLVPTISLRQLPTLRRGTLPFTGFALWLALLTALGLAGGGLGLRRLGKEVVVR